MNRPEPVTLLAAMAAQTSHIGLAATLSTSFYEPYNVARLFGMLDHALRYEKAREFFDIVCGLWDSYDDDAFICDPSSGYYFHPDRLHALNHKGKHYTVRGPLNLARPPQGRPVIAQAGRRMVRCTTKLGHNIEASQRHRFLDIFCFEINSNSLVYSFKIVNKRVLTLPFNDGDS